MTYFVTGGTGFIGRHLIERLLVRPGKIHVLVRRESQDKFDALVEKLGAPKGRLVPVYGDLTKPKLGVGAAALKQLAGKVKHYLFVSTISVYADGSKAGIDESAAVAEYKGKDAMAETMDTLRADIGGLYGPLKALSEVEARKQFGDKVSIVRPGFIVGPRDETDRFTYWPKRIAQGGEVLVPGDGDDPVQIIDGRDLGEWMVRLAENGTTGTFNACGPDYILTTDAMVHGCHAVTGGPVTFTHVPAAFLEEQQVGLPIWVPREGTPFSGYGKVSNAKAIAAGLTFRPLATTVADLLAWYRGLPAERQAEVRAGIPRDKEAEVLAAWKAKQTG